METDLHNRMAPEKSRQGRPLKSEQEAPKLAEVLGGVVPGVIPPMVCPKCGRGMTPRYDRTKLTAKGEIYCNCSLCGGRFAWAPPTVRNIPT